MTWYMCIASVGIVQFRLKQYTGTRRVRANGTYSTTANLVQRVGGKWFVVGGSPKLTVQVVLSVSTGIGSGVDSPTAATLELPGKPRLLQNQQ